MQQAVQTGDSTILEYRRPVLMGTAVICVFFAMLGSWSAVAKISSAAIALGEVAVVTNRKTIQHLEGGIVEDIYVKEGSRVESGQLLVRLSKTLPQANLEQLQARYLAAAAREARLMAERDLQGTIAFPDAMRSAGIDSAVSEVVAGEQSIFRARQESLQSHKAILRQRIAQYQEEIEGLEGEVDSADRQLALLADEIGSMQTLLDKKLVSKQRYLELNREEAEVKGEKNSDLALIARARQNIAEQELQILELDTQRSNEVVAELREVQTQLHELREQIAAAKDIMGRTDIVAPMAGTVVHLQVHTKGGVIGSREPLMDIVPSEDQLIVNARVSPQDIDVVTEGLSAQVRLLAFDQREMLPLNGRVSLVSADRLLDDRTGESFYLAKIEMTQEDLQHQGVSRIQPGMQAEVMIATGERTALAYLTEPLTRSIRRAFRED